MNSLLAGTEASDWLTDWDPLLTLQLVEVSLLHNHVMTCFAFLLHKPHAWHFMTETSVNKMTMYEYRRPKMAVGVSTTNCF